VDIALEEADYDTCLTMYGSGQCDAVCITNMDVLNPSLRRPSVSILPTSTSYGADALIVTKNITDITDLKGKPVYGLAKTVSEYAFVRNLEIRGQSEKDYLFTNMDPSAAALAMQQRQSGYDAIVVWNPFVLSTLELRPDARILADSTAIPGEIIDMVVVAQKSLDAPGGDKFACAVIDTFYAINKRLADETTRDKTLIALGEKFSNLKLDAMRKVVQQTRFYATPASAIELFTGKRVFPDDLGSQLAGETLQSIMVRVVKFCVTHDIVDRPPSIGYGSKDKEPKAALRFDPTYLQKVSQQ
jgi:NitT/TauT family transport system substrate-binding protein